MENTTPAVTTLKVYSPHGFDCIVRLDTTDPTELMARLDAFAASGFSPQPPRAEALDDGEKAETITTAVRREHRRDDGEVIPVIDVYGDRQKFRFTVIYLDNADQVAAFEAAAGVQIAQMPVYEPQGPLKRDLSHPHRCEVTTPPFEVIKTENGMKNIGGAEQMTYRFSRYGGMTQPSTAPAGPPPPATAEHWADNGANVSEFFARARALNLKAQQVLDRLEDRRLLALRETTLSKREALARLEEMANQQTATTADRPALSGSSVTRPAVDEAEVYELTAIRTEMSRNAAARGRHRTHAYWGTVAGMPGEVYIAERTYGQIAAALNAEGRSSDDLSEDDPLLVKLTARAGRPQVYRAIVAERNEYAHPPDPYGV